MSTFADVSSELKERLVEQVLENQHLYAQNAAMKHGIPSPPKRVEKRTTTRSIKTEPPHVIQQGGSVWKDVILPLLFGGTLGALTLLGAWSLAKKDSDKPEQVKPKALLEYLEEEGIAP